MKNNFIRKSPSLKTLLRIATVTMEISKVEKELKNLNKNISSDEIERLETKLTLLKLEKSVISKQYYGDLF